MRLWLALAAMSSFLSTALPAVAETRIALIIGNSNYLKPSLRLANPVNDAAAMQRALQSAGFQTIVTLNAKRLDFYRAVDQFSAQIGRDPHAIGLFYYAGHGVQAGGTNYLIPVDAEIESEGDLEASAYDVNRVLHAMSLAQNDLNIVILDACRDNPLPKTRGVERGLARMDAPNGTFIAYAAAPGQTAQDGENGADGVFTGELVRAMNEPGVPLEQMFKKVIAGVRADTHGRQQPWSEASIQGDFYFHATVVSSAPTRAGLDPWQLELAFWQSVKDSKNAADFQAYLNRYPHGEFAELAANHLKALPAGHLAAPKASLVTTAASPAVSVPAAANKSANKRQCLRIMQRAQLGETLDDKDRAYLKETCQ